MKKDPRQDYVYRATITLPDGRQEEKSFIVDEENKPNESSTDVEVLNYVYNKFFYLQPDISMYKIQKLYTVDSYAKILMLAGMALDRAECFPN